MTQKQFYKTQAWQRCRAAFISKRAAIDGGMCQVCGQEPGLVVHHIVWLNDTNVNDINISLNENNLRYECQTCHNREKDPAAQPRGRYYFDADGNVCELIPPP